MNKKLKKLALKIREIDNVRAAAKGCRSRVGAVEAEEGTW
jgi:hypothetical protein